MGTTIEIAMGDKLPPDLNLQPSERIILKGSVGAHRRERGTSMFKQVSTNSTQLVLTNQNIIVVTSTMFKKTKAVQHLPLDQIKVVDDYPQLFVARDTGLHVLEVYFELGQEDFVFSSKTELRTWAENISTLLIGNPGDFGSSASKAIPGAASLAETLKGVFGFQRGVMLSSSSQLGLPA